MSIAVLPSIVKGQQFFKKLVSQIEQDIEQLATEHIEETLEQSVEGLLGRKDHERRHSLDLTEVEARCSDCGTRQRRRFSRNGHRRRFLTTLWAVLSIWLPRLICECGGSVSFDFHGLLRPRQRLWHDCDEQIRQWSGLALSLREIKSLLDNKLHTSFGLRTLNRRLHQIADTLPEWRAGTFHQSPPVVLLDAIWMQVMFYNGHQKRDRKGRLRKTKGVKMVPIMVAMGIWPDTGQSRILDWEVGSGPGEKADDWLRFLTRLEERGIRGENGLKLLVSDGGTGLLSALGVVYFGAEHQRCIFHKLRNLWRDIAAPEHLPPEKQRRYKRRIMEQARAIWRAKRKTTALKRYLKFWRQWRKEQPAVVTTLRRDFRATLTFYDVQQAVKAQGHSWDARHLRTTSRLERFNRRLRRKFRQVTVYHSVEGLSAAIHQIVLEHEKSQDAH